MKFCKTLLTVGTVLIVGASAQAHENYTAQDLGTMGGISASATDINNKGVIVGYTTQNGAFIYSNGVVKLLPVTGTTCAFAINDSGTVVGYEERVQVGRPSFPYRLGWAYSGQTLTYTISEYERSTCDARDINALGMIVGCKNEVGYYYSAGVYTELPTKAVGINDSGVILGPTAFLRNGLWQPIVTVEAGTCEAADINNADMIVGNYFGAGWVHHAFRYENGSMSELGNFGVAYTNSWATSINNSNQIVGYCAANNLGAQSRPFSYKDGVLTELTPFLAAVGLASNAVPAAINDNGWIVGTASKDGTNHVFLLIPDPAPVVGISLKDGVPRLTVAADVGSRVALDFADSMSPNSWVNVATNTLSGTNSHVFSDPSSPTGTRFYRARLVP